MQRFYSRQKIYLPLFILIGLFSLFSQSFAQEDTQTDEAVALFNQGQDAHEKGDLKTAVELYQKALKIFPEFPEAEYQLGTALLAQNQTDQAEKSFRRAIELREDWSLPMTSLGAILVRKSAFAEAEKVLAKVIELDEQNASAYVSLTDLRLNTKAAPEILRPLLEKIRVLTSKANSSAALWSARASLERRLGDKVSAKNSLNRALSLEPNNKSAIAESIEIAFAENDPATALENAKKLYKISSDTPSSKYLLARAYAENGLADEALKIIDSMTNPTDASTALRDKIIANSAVNPAELEKQLEKDAKNAVVLGRLCSLLRIDNPVKAAEYCRRANAVEPDNLNYVIGFGAALVQAKNYDGAITIFKKVIEIAPDNHTAHANLAISLFQLKRFAEAKNEYLRLSEKQPDIAITYYFLGIIHDQLTEYADAAANYQKFLQIADAGKNSLEIDKVKLRLPALEKLMKEKKGKK